jgi:hypothetical protein
LPLRRERWRAELHGHDWRTSLFPPLQGIERVDPPGQCAPPVSMRGYAMAPAEGVPAPAPRKFTGWSRGARASSRAVLSRGSVPTMERSRPYRRELTRSWEGGVGRDPWMWDALGRRGPFSDRRGMFGGMPSPRRPRHGPPFRYIDGGARAWGIRIHRTVPCGPGSFPQR